MATITQRKPRVKPTRSHAWYPNRLQAGRSRGLLTITTGKEEAGYHVKPMPAAFGTAYSLTKFQDDGGETYHVNLDGRQSTCECLGFLRWNHCKHIEVLDVLRTDGQL